MLTQPTRQKTCCSILRKDSASRSDQELLLLSAVMRQVPQFQQLDAPTLKSICRKMEYKRFAKGDVIVQEGDQGSEFYVLLTGAVSIYTNRPEEAIGQDPRAKAAAAPVRYVDYTVAQADFKVPEIKAQSRTVRALNHRISYTVDWDALEQKAKDRGEAMSSATSSGAQPFRRSSQVQVSHLGTFTDSESEETEEPQILRSARTVPAGRLARRLSSEKETLEEKSPRRGHQLRTAALCVGSSFGEFSLLGKLPRQSTAKCEERCGVAVLRCEDYQRILSNTESSRRSEWLAFAEAAPILRYLDWSTHLLLEPLVKVHQVSKGERVARLGDPVQVLFLAKGIFAVALPPGERAPEVTTALMSPPSCFGLAAHCRNDTHFQESLTSCSATGKVYVLQTKHFWPMLLNNQKEALTRAAYEERGFHLARASVLGACQSRPKVPLTRQLYAPSERLAVLKQQLISQDGQGRRAMLSRCWSIDSLQPAAGVKAVAEKMPRMEPDLSKVDPKEVPKTRLHSSLLPLWSSSVLEQRQSLHLRQRHGVFHGYGPRVQANRFVTQFFKENIATAQPSLSQSASAPELRAAELQGPGTGEEEGDFFEPFEDEDDDVSSPDMDPEAKEQLRLQRQQEEWQRREEKAAATLQRMGRQFVRHRRKQNHAAARIQRAFRGRKTYHRDTPPHGPGDHEQRRPGTPAATPEAEWNVEEAKDIVSPDQTPSTRHGSILQLNFQTDPKLQDLKKALGRGQRSVRLSRVPGLSPGEASPGSPLSEVHRPDRWRGSEVPQVFVLDLIEKHRLLMETQVLEEWPDAIEKLPRLKRLRRDWENLHPKPSANLEVAVAGDVSAPPDLGAALGALKLPKLPSPRGSLVFSARLSAAHPDYGDWSRGGERDMGRDEIDPAEIYRPRPRPPRFRSMLRRGCPA